MNRWILYGAAAVTVLPSTLAAAQGDPFTRPGIPASMAPADLPPEYRAVRLGMAGAGSTQDAMVELMIRSQSMQTADPNASGFLLVHWTKGEVVDGVGGVRFLVTYRLDAPALSGRLMGGQALRDSGGPGARLKLTLVRLDAIQSITPEESITKESLLRVLGGSSQVPADVSAKREATLSNAKQIAIGMMLYAGDWDDVMPYAQSSRGAYFATHPYVKNREVFKTLNPNGGVFRFNMNLAGVAITAIPSPSEVPLYFESAPWPDGSRVVAFADGHAKVISKEEWDRMQSVLKLKFPRAAKRPLPANWGLREWSDSNRPSGGDIR